MPKIRDLCKYLDTIAPERLAEEWDNVGFLVGDLQRPARRIMTCLTVTPISVREAIDGKADLIVTHHPIPFRALKRMTTDSTVGSMLWQLAGSGISVYSPHTAWDSAKSGINQQLAEGLELHDIRPLQPIPGDPDQLGSGRHGVWPDPVSLTDAIERVKDFLSLERLRFVGRPDQMIQQVAVACGSAGTFLQVAHRAGCQLLLTGETSFHTCQEAAALELSLILPGHFASERFALETLAVVLQQEFPELDIWASVQESDPLNWG